MVSTQEKILSLKDYDPNSTQMVNKARRRQHVMEKNMKASQLIIAAKKLKVERQTGDLNPAANKLRAMKKNDTLPIKAYDKVFSDRIKILAKQVKNLTELKDAQDGFLKEGQNVMLKDYTLEIERLEIEHKQFTIKYEAKLKRDIETAKEAKKAEKLKVKVDDKDDKAMEGLDVKAPVIDEKTELLAHAKELGIDAKKTWGIPKLKKAINTALNSDTDGGVE